MIKVVGRVQGSHREPSGWGAFSLPPEGEREGGVTGALVEAPGGGAAGQELQQGPQSVSRTWVGGQVCRVYLSIFHRHRNSLHVVLC